LDLKRFLETIYLGDRACRSIVLDGWNEVVRIHADCISRIRSPSGRWEYYTDEDITDGHLVFSSVVSCELRDAGHLPNGLINAIDIVDVKDGQYVIDVSIDSIDAEANHYEVILRVVCRDAHLEDPARPELKIR
jgi:hypothetical protein